MNLLVPVTYRLKLDHDAWLQERADKQGHGNKVVVLRRLLDQAMRATARRNQSTKPRGGRSK